MIQLQVKKYELEDKIQLLGEDGSVLYEFPLQLTSEELKELKDALLGKDIIKLAKDIEKLEKGLLNEKETADLTTYSEELNSTAESLIGKICFKEHKDKFIELGGKDRYNEMLGVISDYLLSFFIKRQVKRIDMINSDLANLTIE